MPIGIPIAVLFGGDVTPGLPPAPVGQVVSVESARPKWQVMRPHLDVVLTALLGALAGVISLRG